MKLAVFILFFCFSAYAAVDVEKRRTQIIKIIDEELSEVKRLNTQTGRSNPDLLLRQAELNLEKARLIRERENINYLKIPAKKRSKVNKKKYFSKSSRYFSEANRVCLTITRKFKRYKKMGDVYYILGFNAKEANKQKTAAKYLKKAGQNSRVKITKVKSQISLAEIYYNQKKYEKAVPLYEKALAQYKDKWWTKDSFNLAWCYYRTNRMKKAISKMKEVFEVSKNKKFIDMRPQVERDIGLFFASNNRVDQGIEFYKKIGINFTDQLLRIGVNLLNQGKYTKSDQVLSYALKYEKDPKKISEIYIEKLNLYNTFGKYARHLVISRTLVESYKKNNLTANQIKSLKFQMEKVAAILQRQVIGKTYTRLPKARQKKANQAIEYFELISVVDKKRANEFKYLKAETAYAAGLNQRAYSYYKETYERTLKTKNSKFRMRAVEGMLVVLGKGKKTNYTNNIYVFEAYITHSPKSKKSKNIYERLFNNYIATKQLDKAKTVIDRFVKYYPRDLTQEAMIAKLMEERRKKKDNDSIRQWIRDIDAGKYYVSAKYKNKLQELLTTMQIEDVQGELAKGNKKVALVGYLDILNDKFSTKRSKINAKYNLAALYYELGDADNSYKWSIAALNEMGSKDVLKFSSSFVTISNFLFTTLEFEKSADISKKYIDKICFVNTKKKNIAFKNAAFIYLADGKVQQAEELLKKALKCKIPASYREEVEYEIMREYFVQKNWTRYEQYAMQVSNSSRYYAKATEDFLNLVTLHRKFNNTDKVMRFKSILSKLYYKAKKKNKAVPLRVIDYFASQKISEMKVIEKRLNQIQFKFPENVFARLQKSKLETLTKLTEKANDVQATGSGVGIIHSFKILSRSYKNVAQEIFDFVPKNKSKEYIAAFKKDFNQVGTQLSGAAKQYASEAKRTLKKNIILSKNNFFFQENKVPVKFFGEHHGHFMDRGGR